MLLEEGIHSIETETRPWRLSLIDFFWKSILIQLYPATSNIQGLSSVAVNRYWYQLIDINPYISCYWIQHKKLMIISLLSKKFFCFDLATAQCALGAIEHDDWMEKKPGLGWKSFLQRCNIPECQIFLGVSVVTVHQGLCTCQKHGSTLRAMYV